MSNEESLETRQKNELEVLQAMYPKDIKDLRRKSAWNKWLPLDLSIRLSPLLGGSGTQQFYVGVDLHIICDEMYPNSVPIISLENSKGLSNVLLAELKEALDKKACASKGEEVIYPLAQHVQEFLLENNKQPPESFYDEMIKEQKERKEREKRAEEIEKKREIQNILDHQKYHIEMEKSQYRRKKENLRISESEEDAGCNRRTSDDTNNSFLEVVDESLCQHKKTELIRFGTRNIQRGHCIRHTSDYYSEFSGLDTESGEMFFLSEWNFRNLKDLEKIKTSIRKIEKDLNSFTKLEHGSLAKYFGIKHQVYENNINVYVLEEFIHGTSLSLYNKMNCKVEVNYVKHIAKEILTAIDILHKRNIVHKDVKDTAVYITPEGSVKVSKYSIHRSLFDLRSPGHSTYEKKTDILKFGILVLSLLKGRSVSEGDLDIPSSIHPNFRDFLEKCLTKEEYNRHSAGQLLDHSLFDQSVVFSSPSLVPEQRTTTPDINHYDSKSRINKDFKYLSHLGKGAFGDVIKVENKLDGCRYAIKRIKINTKSKSLYKKIVREVKFISILNHENVVRYYNSWIESETPKEAANGDSDESSMGDNQSSTTPNDGVEARAPSVDLAYPESQAATASYSDDDSSDEEVDWAPCANEEDSESDGIVFERDSNDELSNSSSSEQEQETIEEDVKTVAKIAYLYIQMEFCDKCLRTAIDDNLYLDQDRSQRLFREIVEGLAHIHGHDIIHRDLKPANIFLDSKDRVKIGDFGLATSIISKQNENSPNNTATKVETVDESKTGHVGTALYAAPEINTSSKVAYGKKVDIYSLGIILFEMYYKPLNTAMERITILNNLRLKEIVFPNESSKILDDKQTSTIRWLLSHDISKRPTSEELLQSKYMPSPLGNELYFHEVVNTNLKHPGSKNYQFIIKACLNQPIKSTQEITYDTDISAINIKQLQLQEFVRKVCVKIFEQHGGQNLITPLFLPRNTFHENLDCCVKLMNHVGDIVNLPHDLRVPFARHLAWNGINRLRRYCIERVFRERKHFAIHPIELYECAFDIVTPTPGTLLADAEVLYIVCRILNELPGISKNRFVIRMNHTQLLTAILIHFGIKNKHHDEVYDMISNVKDGKKMKSDLKQLLVELELPDNSIQSLMNLLYAEIEVSKSFNHFQTITKKKSIEAKLATQALQDLKVISNNAEAYGVKLDIMISPGLVYKVQQFSGMIFQFVHELKKKNKHKSNSKNIEVIAGGGRYDSMIATLRDIVAPVKALNEGTAGMQNVKQSAVGVSISLDKLVQALQREEHEKLPEIETLDIAVSSLGEKQMLQEKTKILRTLWQAKFRSALIEGSTLYEIREQITDLKVNQAIILKEPGKVRIESCKEKGDYKEFSIEYLVENTRQIIQNLKEDGQENIPLSVLTRSNSRTNNAENFELILVENNDKISSRKRYETQVRSQLDGLLKKLAVRPVVLGLFTEMTVIKTITSYLEFESETEFRKSLKDIIERCPPRQKKYIDTVCEKIYTQKSDPKNENPVVVLFSVLENAYKIMI